MLVGCGVELCCIVLQAAQARRSHLNRFTPADAAVYATMGAFALLFVGAVLPLAWEIARRPDVQADRQVAMASVLGLAATFVFGGGTGALMSARNGHGVEREHARLPLFGWSMTGGDLRAPHFLGIHAMQALPMMAAGAKALSARRTRPLFAVGATTYRVLTAGLFYQALRGNPIARS